MEKLTKEDIKGPDAFISTMEHVSHFTFNHRATIFGTVAVLLLGGIIWAAVGVYSSSTEEKAQEALFSAEKNLDKVQGDFEKSKTPEKTPDKAPAATKPETSEPAKIDYKKPSGVFETDYSEPESLLKDVIKKYSKTQASVVAALDLSRLYHDNKKFISEIPLLERAADTARHPVIKALTLNQLGLAYEGNGDCGKAIESWQKIEKNTDLSFFRGQSLLKIGLCFEKLNQTDKAQQAYQQAESQTKDQEAARSAKKYLRLLKRDQKT